VLDAVLGEGSTRFPSLRRVIDAHLDEVLDLVSIEHFDDAVTVLEMAIAIIGEISTASRIEPGEGRAS
jgi:hypothetical protein